jgi:thioredoxin 1
MDMGSAAALNEGNFAAATGSGVSLVDFWAVWCGPCRMIAPLVEELAGEYAGKANIAKVDVDEAPGLAEKFGVSSIPTLLVLKNGQEVKRFVGVTKKQDLTAAIDAALA